MTLKDVEYLTRDDDSELNETLKIMHNTQMIFENCRFSLVTNKQFTSCMFINCIFDYITKDTHFTNCTLEAPTFYEGFHGKLENCNITKYTGPIGELPEKRS